MSGFTMDTSGVVTIPGGPHAGDWTWDRVRPFDQGYVEAMFESIVPGVWKSSGPTKERRSRQTMEGFGSVICGPGGWHGEMPDGAPIKSRRNPEHTSRFRTPLQAKERFELELARFDRIHPSALALILKDCEDLVNGGYRDLGQNAAAGRDAWNSQRNGQLQGLPIRRPYIDDDGRVCLREASQ